MERHTTLNEVRWLILHGVLHLLGYDHERDSGEMVALELALREQLGMSREEKQFKSQNAKHKSRKLDRPGL
jgi:ssRNA-specific RNase YbeY (16S rRNA maturation enzyme)